MSESSDIQNKINSNKNKASKLNSEKTKYNKLKLDIKNKVIPTLKKSKKNITNSKSSLKKNLTSTDSKKMQNEIKNLNTDVDDMISVFNNKIIPKIDEKIKSITNSVSAIKESNSNLSKKLEKAKEEESK